MTGQVRHEIFPPATVFAGQLCLASGPYETLGSVNGELAVNVLSELMLIIWTKEVLLAFPLHLSIYLSI